MKPSDRKYSCQDVCGQFKHCGNRHCSNHPAYVPPAPKNKKRAEKRRRDALHPKKVYTGGGMRQSAY